jgi:cob(I)alamin adenosyltransferase
MAGDLDQISAAIGELRADAKNQRAATERVFEKLDEISDRLAITAAVKDTLERIEPLVDKHEQTHRTGRGILIGLSIASGTAGGAVTALLRKWGVTQ